MKLLPQFSQFYWAFAIVRWLVRDVKLSSFYFQTSALFSSSIASATNEYRGGEMPKEVNVDRNLWKEIVIVDGSESALREWLHGKTFDFRVHRHSSRPVLTFFILVFFSLFFNLKLPIMSFSYFVIQFNIKTFGKNSLFNH